MTCDLAWRLFEKFANFPPTKDQAYIPYSIESSSFNLWEFRGRIQSRTLPDAGVKILPPPHCREATCIILSLPLSLSPSLFFFPLRYLLFLSFSLLSRFLFFSISFSFILSLSIFSTVPFSLFFLLFFISHFFVLPFISFFFAHPFFLFFSRPSSLSLSVCFHPSIFLSFILPPVLSSVSLSLFLSLCLFLSLIGSIRTESLTVQDGMKRFGMSWSGAGSNSWTNEPTDRTAGACSQIDARGSSWAPLFVYLLHPLYSLLTLLILVHSALQDRKGQVGSSRSLSFSPTFSCSLFACRHHSHFFSFYPFLLFSSLLLTLPFCLYALISPLPPSPAFSLSGSATSLSISTRSSPSPSSSSAPLPRVLSAVVSFSWRCL